MCCKGAFYYEKYFRNSVGRHLVLRNGEYDSGRTLVHVCRWDRAEARKQLERFRQTLMKDKLHLLLLKRESAGEFANAIFFHDPQNPEGDFFIEYLFESPAERQKYHPHVREIRDQMAAKWREMASNPNAN